MNIVIIGGSFAGVSCALQAMKLYPNATVKVIEQQGSVGFIPSGLNLKLNEEIKELSHAHFMSETDILKTGVRLLKEQRVTTIDKDNQTVTMVHTQTGQERVEPYDKLVLAMGSKQSSTLVESLESPFILSTKQFQCAENADRIVEQSQHIAVIGGGQIGIEASEALVNANKQVSLIEGNATLASRYFDPEFVADIQQAIEMTGVDLRLNEAVESITDNPLCVTTSQGDIYPDAIIMGVNLLPQSQLVANLVALNEDGTVQVDDYFATSVPNIYAIGDLVQVPYRSYDDTRFIALVNNAIRSGQVAAFNLAKHHVKRPVSLRVIGSRVFSDYVVSVGMTQSEAQSQAMDVHTVLTTAPFSLTDTTDVYLKLVVERQSGRLMGAQMRSESNILSMANVLALAVGSELTDEQLAFQDRLYYPNETAAYPIVYQAALESFGTRQA